VTILILTFEGEQV